MRFPRLMLCVCVCVCVCVREREGGRERESEREREREAPGIPESCENKREQARRSQTRASTASVPYLEVLSRLCISRVRG